MQKRSSGFSLAELMTVVGMVGVITLVTLPALMQLMPQYRIRSASTDAAAAMRLIRQKAITLRTPCKITFDAANERYSYWMLNTPNVTTAILSNNANWLPLTTDARATATSAQWILTTSVDLRINTSNAFKDVDCPRDALVDLIFLRNGSVSKAPTCGGADVLTFTTPPSVLFGVDNRLVKFNRYYIALNEAGTVTVTPRKE
jgi:type IV fimbrial biogenesis protein FimT